MKRLILLTLCCIFSATLLQETLSAKENSDQEEKVIPMNRQIKYGKLPNGLTYYIRENSTPENRAELRLVVKAGSINEEEDQRGLAHFAEHMSFNGTKNFPKNELTAYFESIGMEFGPEINAYTSFNETVYMLKIPLENPEFKEKGLQVLYDWACQNSDTDEDIENERGVIVEEWRSGKSMNKRILDTFLPIILKDSKYPNRLPIGDMKVVEEGDPQRLRDFREEWYRPDLQAIMIVGDFNADEIEKEIIAKFSKIPSHRSPKRSPEATVPLHKETLIKITTDKDATYTVGSIDYKHPVKELKQTTGEYRTTLTHSLYAQMMGSRFGEILKEEQPPFLYASSNYGNLMGLDASKSYNATVASHPGKLVEGFEAMLIENERVKRFGFTQSELDRAKSNSLKRYEKLLAERDNMESASIIGEMTRNFLSSESIPGIEAEVEMAQEFIPNITLEEINRLAKEWITDDNRVIIAYGPENEKESLPTEEELLAVVSRVENSTTISPYNEEQLDKSIMPNTPTAGTIISTTPIKNIGAEEWTLSNGIKVIVKQTDFKSDEILMSSTSPGGYSIYGDDISSQYAAQIMDESGISKYSLVTLSKMLAGKQVGIAPYISLLEEGVSGSSTITDFETMLQLTHLYYTDYRMDESTFNSEMNKFKSSLENRENSPNAIFGDSIRVNSFNNHYLFRSMTKERLKELSFTRMKEVIADRFKDASETTFIFVGNIGTDADKQLIAKYIGSLPTSNRVEKWVDPKVEFQDGIVDKKIYKGENDKCIEYIKFSSKQKYNVNFSLSLHAAIKILGSRLLKEIREEQTNVYHIGAQNSVERLPETTFDVDISYGCSVEKSDSIQIDIFKEIRNMQSEYVTEEELNTAKEKIKRSKEEGVGTNNYWLQTIKSKENGSTDNYSPIEEFNREVDKITLKSIKRAMKRGVDLNNYASFSLLPESAKP